MPNTSREDKAERGSLRRLVGEHPVVTALIVTLTILGAVLGGPASNLTWYLGANRFFGGPSGGASHCGCSSAHPRIV